MDSDGNSLDPDNFYHREFLSALKRAGVKRVRFHDLRHTNVSLRIEEGQSIVYIARQIGHESAKTTLDVYGHLMKDVNHEEAQKLDRALGLGLAGLPDRPSQEIRYLLGKRLKDERKGAASLDATP